MRNKLISVCLVIWLLLALPHTVNAQAFDYDRKGSISVTLASANGQKPAVGAELSVYYVATVGINTDGNLNYICTDAFEAGGISLEDPQLPAALDAFVAENDVPSQKLVTDLQGKASCADLPLGLYFVKQTGAAEGFALCSSFLVTVPMETEAGYLYDVDVSPKTDIARYIDITIRKVWNTDATAQLPESVQVQLLRGDTVVETVTLRKENQWQAVCRDLPESDAYGIKEIGVPQGFTDTYSRTGYEFTVTNTASLAQTGQLVWPIPLFATAGLVLLMIGIAVLRKSGQQDA